MPAVKFTDSGWRVAGGGEGGQRAADWGVRETLREFTGRVAGGKRQHRTVRQAGCGRQATAAARRAASGKQHDSSYLLLSIVLNATGAKGPRVNEMVHVISSDTEETPFQPKVQAPRKSRVSVKAEPTEKMPALFVDNHKTPRIKMESSLTTTYTPTPEVTADAKDLPLFLAKTWATSFLPALYRELYRSADPMAFRAVGTDVKHPGKATVAILQAVLDTVYPGNTWKIQWGDAICAKVCHICSYLILFLTTTRLSAERRSAFGKAGDAAVQAHFNAPRYFKDHDAALRKRAITQSDALYALQQNGPAFWKYPTPESASHILDPKDPEYIKPKDYLESSMIIATLSQFITAFDDYELIVATHPETGKQMVDPSLELPIGALGMAAAAVERAYGAHKTGQYLKPSAFSAAHVGTAVAGFIVSINNFSVTRWEAILAACGTRAAERGAATEHRLQATSLNGVHENMYVQSSP
ncbi:hypothetical protein GGX14DRAFT_386841 [Mycena pura]|uniref:Uncharacterized protein n=1 Tax=Mycena pura TaxID=153505 RepID=A0AAD6YMJ5_9AGAR|nr:hypothetical protein GGX14DRAFT_386841 [Mycena pura]